MFPATSPRTEARDRVPPLVLFIFTSRSSLLILWVFGPAG